MEVILGIFLTYRVKSYLFLTKFWENVRILAISEKSDLTMHSGLNIIIRDNPRQLLRYKKIPLLLVKQQF